ncbi:pentapeptide repeat-containing protein [Amycolatopsis sp. NPDC004625]|uniref:pentapeptide repeat-containing protein n=1 Tax=Amycolatopsis sp. NPDC004625 TaxID=3154670 RepID=UPI0033A4DABE
MTESVDPTPTGTASDRDVPTGRPVLRPIPRWVVVAGVPVMVLVAAAAAWLLLGYGANRDQLDAIRTAGTIGVGFGGVVALWLAVRRQRSTELDLLQKYEAHQLAERIAAQNANAADRAAAHAEHDARERRLTDLYLKAVEQLGSDKAAVRHGGLYALERVAQNNPEQRQTVVDVICAYLRGPYTLPRSSGQTQRLSGMRRPLITTQAKRREVKIVQSTTVPAKSVASTTEAQEREVRLTAQRLLARHLNPGDDPEHPVDTFWDDVGRVDLTGATLIDFDFNGCRIKAAEFSEATFVGDAWFNNAGFAGFAGFSGAIFAGNAWFDKASFGEITEFGVARFQRDAWFDNAAFASNAVFDKASFAGGAWFGEATFAGTAGFAQAKFSTEVEFRGARFAGGAWFSRANFAGFAGFSATNFAGNAWFDKTSFNGEVWFDEASFAADASFGEASFAWDAEFSGAGFGGYVQIGGTNFARGTPASLHAYVKLDDIDATSAD